MAKKLTEETLSGPVATEQQEALEETPTPRSDKVVIYSANFGDHFSKLCRSPERPLGLQFKGGEIAVTKAELEIVKKSPYWGRYISNKKFVSPKGQVVVKTDRARNE